ncbi:MAG: hypothetical protein IPM64_09620 [Phycisphaerales bacterium]|nr:hypothetical protein [Phycisphaerales bacterium]
MKRHLLVMCISAGPVLHALGDIATSGSASVSVNQLEQTVTITSSGTCTVSATVGTYTADVDRITVSGSGIGDVTLTIAAARDIGYIDLTGSTGTLAGLSITGTVGVINATNTQVSTITGTISTGGKTDRLISAASASSATFSIGGDCKGISIGSGSVSSLTVAGDLLGAISVPTAGALTISGSGPHTGDISITGAGPHSGTVTISNDYSGDMTLTGDRSGQVRINGDLTSTGSVTFTGEMSGHLVIGDAPNSPVAGRFSGLNQMDLAGTVTLGTPASPPQEFTGGIDITGELTGTLKINGTVANDDNWIWIRKLNGGTLWITDDLALRRPTATTTSQGWLEIGDFSNVGPTSRDAREAVNHTGTIRVDGELQGRIYVVGSSKIHFDIGTINSTVRESVQVVSQALCWGLGGITFGDEFRNPGAGNAIEVGDFVSGEIRFAPVTWPETDGTYGGTYYDGVSADDFDFAGQIVVNGDMEDDASIHNQTRGTETDSALRDADLSGRISVLGSLEGLIRSERHLNEQIRVHGDLVSAGSPTERVHVADDLKWPAAITIDWDGCDDGDDWGANARVYIGGDIEMSDAGTISANGAYSGNTPGHRVYEITCCRGDMDNTGDITNFDIDPFVEALTFPQDYDDNWPGLEGSRDWHGDCNEDAAFNNFDTDPFVCRVIALSCECSESLLEGDPPTGAEVGEQFRNALSADLREPFAGVIEGWIEIVTASEQDAGYWIEFRDALVAED